MSPIASQQQLLRSTLANHGWRIAERSTDLPWWADEVWTLESEWSPNGLNAYVVFLVDPFVYSSNRRQGEDVWAVRCTSNWLDPRGAPEIGEWPLKRWPKQVVQLADSLSAFRDGQT